MRLGTQHAWLTAGDTLYAIARGAHTEAPATQGWLLGCTGDRAILRRDGRTFRVCGPECQDSTVALDRPAAAVALESGVLAFETRAGVMKLHSAGPPRYLAVPDGFEALGATASATQVDVIGHVYGTIAILRFPVP